MTNPPWQDRGPDDAAIDAAFAAIVAGWDLTAEPGLAANAMDGAGKPGPGQDGPTRPDAPPSRDADAGAASPREDRPAGGSSPAAPLGPAAPPSPAAPPGSRGRTFEVAPEGWRVHVPPEASGSEGNGPGQDGAEESEEGFEPPDPPLPRGEPRYWIALTGLLLGPLVFIVWALTAPHSTTLPLYLAGIATLAGFVALVSRLPETHDEDDDGARV